MTGTLSWESTSQSLILRGELDRETLLPLWKQREALLAGVQCIDVAQLERVDSAGLAMIVHFQEQARQQGITLTISGITDRLRTLIDLYNLQDIIPINT